MLNPDSFRFTWRRKTPEVQCRRDCFLVNQSTFCNTFEADIIPGYKTDHSMITLQISLHSNKRGRGFWKLNTSLLKDIEYVNRIKLIINRTKEEYANDETVDPSLLWEMVKMKVREESIKFGAHKKKKIEEKQEEIEQSIAFLEKNLARVFTDDAVKQKMWSELETKKRELETIIERQIKGAILRTKSRWYNEGERSTKYFFNLEKRHCKQGTISQLKINDEDLVHTDKEILHECESFYRNLYSSKTASNLKDDFFPPQQDLKFLNETEKSVCEGSLNRKECLEALKSMAPEKHQVQMAFPVNFIKFFGTTWQKFWLTL